MLNKNKKGIINLCIIIVSILAIIGLTMAYFTDTATLTEKGTAGTVSLNLIDNINFLDGDNKDILVPGDMRSAGFEVVNVGNKSVDIRTTLALTVNSEYTDLVFSGSDGVQSEFDLYYASDVTYVDGVGYVLKNENVKPLAMKDVYENTITYYIDDITLNGNSAMYDEVETVDGVNTYKHYYDFVLLFKNDTPDTWENCYVIIDVVIEAKQHENVEDNWTIVEDDYIDYGHIYKDAVPEENVITDSQGNMN